MKFHSTGITGLIHIQPDVFGDNRGFFLESYTKEKFVQAGIPTEFVQDNHSCSMETGVLRGLHFQKPPHAQAKLVRVTRGRIWDVAVDLRKKSPTFGQWEGFELSAENFEMLLIPSGFAHGFCTLEPQTHVQYKVDTLYAPSHDSGIIWNDPDLGITWPVTTPILSAKDARLPFLKDNLSPF